MTRGVEDMVTAPAWLGDANDEAVYNVYLYLIRKIMPQNGETLSQIVFALRRAMERQSPRPWSLWDIRKLHVLEGAVARSTTLASARIGNVTRSKSGLNACSFEKPDGTISVVFRGTAGGEWIDNGEGLSGIPEENTYITYASDGTETLRVTVTDDFATDQQVEALNWFCKIAAVNGWNEQTRLRVSGHSKGGNKAQFITMHSPLVHTCFCFDGQGFSPEAIAAFETSLGDAFATRVRRMVAVCGENDFVHVLGKPLILPSQTCYIETFGGLHAIDAMLDSDGVFRPVTTRGALAARVAAISDDLMALAPAQRQYAVRGTMNVLQTVIGTTAPVGGSRVSAEDTIAGLALTLRTITQLR